MQTHRILLVVTSSDRMGTAPEPTGLWLEELAAPYYAFVDARCDVTIASPQGGAAPVDPRSTDDRGQTASTRRFESDIKAQHKLAHTMKLSAISLADYDAVFFAGGHGTMDDFATAPVVKQTATHAWAMGKTLAAVCHGSAALVDARDSAGKPIIAGQQFTCFSDEEERLVALDRFVPFLLQSRLVEQGGHARCGEAFQPNVVVDGNLVTGQNPASSIPVAEAVIHQLRQKSGIARAA